MKKPVAVWLFACMLLGLSCGLALADNAEPRQEVLFSQSWATANTYLAQGDYEQAYRLYQTLLAARPQHHGVMLGFARAAMRSGRYGEALPVYRQLCAAYPGDLRLHAEWQAAGRIADSQDVPAFSGSLILADELPALPESAPPERLTVHGKLAFGVIYDSNANQGPASGPMRLGDYHIVIEGLTDKESMGAYLSLGADIAYRLAEQGNWWAVGGADFYIRGNANHDLDELKSREWQWFRLNSGLRYMDDSNLLEVRVKGEVFDYHLYSSAFSLGPTVTYAHALNRSFHLISMLGMDYRDYNRGNDRDGMYLNLGQYGRWFFGQAGHDLMAGLRYRGGYANFSDFSYDGWEAYGRLNLVLPHGFELTPFATYGQDFYHGPATVLERDKRRDDRLCLGLGLTYHITSDWRLEASYQYVKNHSLSDFYDYDQHVLSCGMAWSF